MTLDQFWFIVLDDNKSDLADTLSVLLTVKTLELPETKNWLLQGKSNMP